jgi:helix-turn-helix protein
VPMPVGDGSGSRAHAVILVLSSGVAGILGLVTVSACHGVVQGCQHETVTRETVSRWETGKRVPGPWWLRHLATVLQVPVEILERAGVDRRHFLTDVVGMSIAQLVASDLIEHGFAAALHGGYPTADD